MSLNGTNLSANAASFIPRAALTQCVLNPDQNIAIGSYNSWMVNPDNFRNHTVNSIGHVFDYSFLPLNSHLNSQCIPQVIYAWPQFPYTISSQNISLPLNESKNNPCIDNQNNLTPQDKNINYSNVSFQTIIQNIETINNNDKINSIEHECTILRTENKELIKHKILNNSNSIIEPSILNLDTSINNENKLPCNVMTAKRVKKKKGKSFICIDEYEKNKGVNHDKLKTVDNLMKPFFKSYSYVASNKNNEVINNIGEDPQLLQNSTKLIKDASNNKFIDDNKIKPKFNINKTIEIINNKNISNELLNNNFYKNIAMKEVSYTSEKPKFTYSAIVKKKDDVVSKTNENDIVISNKTKIDKSKKELKEICPNNPLLNHSENCVQIESNKMININNIDTLNKSLDFNQIKYKVASTDIKTNDNNSKNHLSSKNWTYEGKLLFNEWKKSKSKYSEENKPEAQKPFIMQQTAHLLTFKNKNNKTLKDVSYNLHDLKSTKEEIIRPKEESKDNVLADAELENWSAVKNKSRIKILLTDNYGKKDNLENLININPNKFEANSFKTEMSQSKDKMDNLKQVNTYLTNNNINIVENKYIRTFTNDIYHELNYKNKSSNITQYKFKNKESKNMYTHTNISNKFPKRIVSDLDMNIKIDEKLSKNELILQQNSKKKKVPTATLR